MVTNKFPELASDSSKPLFSSTIFENFTNVDFLSKYETIWNQKFTTRGELDDEKFIEKLISFDKTIIGDVYSKFFQISKIQSVTMPGTIGYMWKGFTTHTAEMCGMGFCPYSYQYYYALTTSKNNLIALDSEVRCHTNNRAGLPNNMRFETMRCTGEFRLYDTVHHTPSLDNVNMLTVSKSGAGRNTALVVTLEGLDVVHGHKSKPNIVVVGGGTKLVTAGTEIDLIIIDSQSEHVNGFIDAGLSADNSLFIKSYPASSITIKCPLSNVCALTSPDQSTELFLHNVQHIVGLSGKSEKVNMSCALKSLELNGGVSDNWVEISLSSLSCKHQIKLPLRSYTSVYQTSQGDSKMTYDVITGPVRIELPSDQQTETLINVETSTKTTIRPLLCISTRGTRIVENLFCL